MTTSHAQPPSEPVRPRALDGFAPRLALVALGLFGLGAVLGLTRLAPGLPAFGVALAGVALSVLALIAALVTGLRGRRRAALIAVVIGAIAPTIVVASWLAHGDAPPINEATTDLLDPPAIPDAPATLAPDVAAHHARAYGDLAPLTWPVPPDAAYAAVAAHLRADPDLTLVSEDPARRLIHLTATSGVFGFVDDVAVRVSAVPDGHSRIDVRSRSREGKSDLGVNARRVRALLAALAAAAPTGPRPAAP